MEQNILTRDGFQPDMLIDVRSDANEPLFTGRVRSLEGDFVIVVNADDSPLPHAVSNKTAVRLHSQLSGDRLVAYSGTVIIGSSIFWKIGRLEGGPLPNKRQFYRQPVSAEAIVIPLAKGGGANAFPDVPAACTIMDVSGGGLRIRCDESFEVGDQLLVADVCLLEGEAPFDFGCTVRRTAKEGGSNSYGCQFESLSESEQARLINIMFLLQQKSRRRSAQE